MEQEVLARLVDLADVEALVRLVDQSVTAEDWDGLLQVREACRFALATGRQLWPVAAYAEHRVALDAPGAWVGKVLTEAASLMTVGPLSEVAASTHAWDELSPHVEAGPIRAFVAYERALRGEDLESDDSLDHRVLELPFRICNWEPSYALPEYRPDGVDAPPPRRPALRPVTLPAPVAPAYEHDDSRDALREIVAPWTASSNGRADLSAVEGDHLAAVAALGVPAGSARIAEVPGAEGLAWLQWAAASGGAHARRRGGAAGRFSAWWAVTAMADALEDWPISTIETDQIVQALRWFVWDAHEPVTGWQLRLAIWDPDDGLAWAIERDRCHLTAGSHHCLGPRPLTVPPRGAGESPANRRHRTPT